VQSQAHHCSCEEPKETDDEDLKGDDKKEAEKNNEAARLWISGFEEVNRKLGLPRVIDLSATPFFLRGSGSAEGTLFPWTISDFSLMDAIECGIVKLPRVPVAETIPGDEMPMFNGRLGADVSVALQAWQHSMQNAIAQDIMVKQGGTSVQASQDQDRVGEETVPAAHLVSEALVGGIVGWHRDEVPNVVPLHPDRQKPQQHRHAGDDV
jgi:rhodanese-related sulfurtransferase